MARKIFSFIISVPYLIVVFPTVLFILLFLPIMGIGDIRKVINTGFGGSPQLYYGMLTYILFGVFFSLQVWFARQIYKVFPFLYRVIEFLTIVGVSICFSNIVLNWSFQKLDAVRNTAGIMAAIGILILARVVLSVYYYKHPMISLEGSARSKGGRQ